jgi:hypothetical protein
MAQSNEGRDNVPYDTEKLRDWVRHLWFQEVGWNDYCRSRRVQEPTFFYFLRRPSEHASASGEQDREVPGA